MISSILPKALIILESHGITQRNAYRVFEVYGFVEFDLINSSTGVYAIFRVSLDIVAGLNISDLVDALLERFVDKELEILQDEGKL